MKPLVYIHSYEKDDPTKGISEKYVSWLKKDFEVTTAEELKKGRTKVTDVRGVVLLPSRMKFLDPFLKDMKSLGAAATLSVGLDKIPVDYFKQQHIPVGYCPAFRQQNKTVADHAIILMLLVKRKFLDRLNSLKPRYTQDTGEFSFNHNVGNDVSNLTMGIVGLGRIGLEIAKRAKAFDMKVVYYNRTQRQDLPDGMKCEYYANLHTMLPVVDVLMIACALNEHSNALISEPEFALMRRSSIIVNIARGKIIHTESMLKALQTNQIAGAGLDVTDPEPLPVGHSLYNMDNVVVTPHCASHTYEAKDEVWQMCIANLKAALIEHKHMPYPAENV